jgi:RHS repeat-associated protein
VKSNANPFTNAATTSANEFSAWVQAAPGANTLTVEAKDNSPNANTRTQSWSVNITGQSRTPSYDLNGNMTANGLGQTYLWDAENRLVKITYADNSKTEFIYDGLSRRIRITERNASNTITSDKRYLWSGGNQPAEERETNGTTVSKRYFPQGEQRIGGADAGFYYYTKDHLGSIREITNSSGVLVTRYDFDLWGKRTKLSGSMETDVGFTGHHHHAKSSLVLTWYRVYDTELGRWLSVDPLEIVTGEIVEMLPEGSNLYAYIGNNSINGWDEEGLRFAGLQNIFRNLFSKGKGKGKGGAGAGAPCPKKFGNDMGAGGRRLAHMQGMGKALGGARPPGVPKDWVHKAGKGGVGHRWINPNNKQEVVRVMPGNPKSPHGNSQKPYCRRTDKGALLKTHDALISNGLWH